MSLTYSQAVEQTITAGEQIHQIVNGTATTEVTVEDGSKVPSIRKALLDNFYFKDPVAWQVGQTEKVFNQLRQFTDGSWWYAPSATASNPISMGSTPIGDSLWKIYDFDAIGKLEPRVDEALRRSYAEAGFNLVDGSFEAGGTLVNANDVLLQERTGKAFSGPAGTVAAGTNPASGGFVDKSGVATSASAISNANGGSVQDFIDKENLERLVPIQAFGGGESITDNRPAFLLSKTTLGYVYFPRVEDNNEYSMSIQDGDYDGVDLYSDQGVTVKVGTNSYAAVNGAALNTDIQFFFTDLNFPYLAKKNTSIINGSAQALPIIRNIKSIDRYAPNYETECDSYNVNIGSDTLSLISPSVSNNWRATLTDNTSGYVAMVTDVEAGDTVSAFASDTSSQNQTGVFILGSNGYYFIGRNADSQGSNINEYTKVFGSAETSGTIGYQDQGVLTSYEPDKSCLSVTVVDTESFIVQLNGNGLGRVYTGIGTILKAGIGSRSTVSGTLYVNGLTVSHHEEINGRSPIDISIYGDSTADNRWFGAFDQYIPLLLNGCSGLKVGTITNHAVAGESLTQQYARMQTKGFGTSFYVVVVAMTNDIQGQNDINTVATTLQNVLNLIISSGRRPIIVEPWMWYPKQGSRGQTTFEYDAGGIFRGVAERITTQAGGIYVRTTQMLPAPLLAYLSEPDSLLRDGIHQSQLGYQLYAHVICEALANDYVKPKNSWFNFPANWLSAGFTASGRCRYTESGLEINATFIGAAPITDGTQIFRLPRKYRSVSGINLPVVATDLTDTKSAWLNINGLGYATAQSVGNANNYIILSSVF
ncbi:hypothetical protein phiA047_0116 [Aeromonas phage phiA047]|nr:hypothetical protein phiA047_0116 [Aeromonas phage phiA047]